MVTSIGRTTSPSTATLRDDVSGTEPASFRYNNPGAQYPSTEAARFGQTGYGIIGGDHKIARFPSPVNGAASNFDLLFRKYVGMSIGAAGRKWTGAHGFGVPGYNPDSILTRQMLDDPVQAIALLKAIAARESGRGNNLTELQWRQAHAMFKAGSADKYLDSLPADTAPTPQGAKTGAGLLQRAQEHIGEEYRHVLVPKDDANWKGPWDCAEFMSWLVFQEAGILYGCVDDQSPPAKAEAYTGAWKTDLERLGKRVSVEEAAATVGGIVLRYPPGPGKMGHIAVCDGKGGTVEAKGRRYGIVADTVHGRGWHAGILIPGIAYDGSQPIRVLPPDNVYEINAPNMDKGVVVRIQQALAAKGFDPGIIDGDFGPKTRDAVTVFQEAEGLVVDGAVGPETAAALGVSLLVTEDAGRAVGAVDTVGDQPKPVEELVTPKPEPVTGTSLQQLILALILSLQEKKPMADDTSKPSATPDFANLLLALLLQSALSGKRVDLAEMLAAQLGGKPILPKPSPSEPASAPAGGTASQAQPSTQAPADIGSLLLLLLYQKLTGQTLPGSATPPTPAKPADEPTAPAQPVTSKPSVQLSAAALAVTSILQAIGVVGTPFGMGTEPTQTGTLATLIPILTGAVGATGGFGVLLNIGRALLGGLANAAKQK